MADTLKCEVPGCGERFTPGKDGAAGRCWMHYMRKKRNSPNADEPGRMYSGTRTEKVTAYLSEAVKEKAATLAAKHGQSMSEWIADAIEDHTHPGK